MGLRNISNSYDPEPGDIDFQTVAQLQKSPKLKITYSGFQISKISLST